MRPPEAVLLDWLRRWRRRLKALVRRESMWREMDEEMRFHVEMESEELMRQGVEPQEARRRARVRFGSVERYQEEGRESWGVRVIDDALQDLRYALRGLRRAPGFAVAAVVTLALGIGANSTIFSVVDGVLLKPLPYPEPERLVRVFEQNDPANRWSLSVVDYQAIESRQNSFTGVAGLARGNVTLTGRSQPQRVRVGFVTDDWFNILGVQPAVGRGFRPEEARPGAERVAVVSHAFAESYFGLESKPVGRSLELDGVRHTVVGVLPRGVESLAGWRAPIWPILQLGEPTRRGPFFISGLGRLRDGVTLAEAARELAQISERIFPLWAETFQDREARLTPVPLREVMVGNVRTALLLLFGAVGFVLVIAVTNVANLQLARASGREREVALRASLGATRLRLARQLLVEGSVLALSGGLIGTLLAVVGLDVLVRLGPQLPRLAQVQIDGRVLSFTIGISAVSGVLFGLAPLLHTMSPQRATALRDGGRIGATAGRTNVLRGALVSAEFALALPLLAGAALLFTSLGRMHNVDPGFDPDGVLVARTSLPRARYADARSIRRFWERALPRLVQIPGVEAAGMASGLPPDDPGDINNFDLLDKPVAPGQRQPVAPWLSFTPSYFAALGVPLLRGRLPDETDASDGPAVAAVSESWAERYYPGEDVLGKQMFSGGNRERPVTIVGVVGDATYQGLANPNRGAVYRPFNQYTVRTVNLALRTRQPARAMAQVRGRLHKLDPDLALANVQRMNERLSASMGRPRYWATLVGIFAVVGLILATVGIYGLLSYFVARQSRDIGIRIALGANASSVLRMVLRRGMTQVILGLSAGLAAALLLTRWLESLLFAVSPTDPATFGLVSLLLVVVALAACYWPARRATRIDPVRVLSEE